MCWVCVCVRVYFFTHSLRSYVCMYTRFARMCVCALAWLVCVSRMSSPEDYLTSIVPFCGVSNVDDCIVEYLLLMWPYYIFILILLPVRTYEIRLLPRSYPPQWWPISHLLKRGIILGYMCVICVATVCLFVANLADPYVLLSAFIHISCWGISYWILASEYKRYQPLTWFGLRGFWLLTGFEGIFRTLWLFTSPLDSTPMYGREFPGSTIVVTTLLTLLESVMSLLVLFVPNDLNMNLLGHIQRLLLEHPSGNSEYCTNQPAIYTLHEDDNGGGAKTHRADTPGWIYSVEEELPFYPKIDIIDVFVLAVNRDRRIKTVYRIHTRVTTDTQLVVEFNSKRRYRELRSLDDKLRSVFDHSKFPEQRASLGNFPPRELTQADPFARQIAIREYFRRLSGNPIFYTHEFLDMIGIDPRFDSGRLYESCLNLQAVEQSKLPIRFRPPAQKISKSLIPGNTPPPARVLTIEPMPWRPPLSSGTSSPCGAESSFVTTPPVTSISVYIPDYTETKRVVYYRILTHITTSQTRHVCESRHRFSDFQRLSVHLKDYLHLRLSVPLPRLIRIPGSQSVDEFLDSRKKSLQEYLQSVLSDYPNIVASRFVRTFFKVPADLILPATPFGSDAAEWDTEEANTTLHRATPTGSKLSAIDHEEVAIAITPDRATLGYFRFQSSIPFFSYCVTCDPPMLRYCVRITETLETDCEWTRFHTFEEFVRLKNDLNLNWNDIDNGLAFPSMGGFKFITHMDADAIKAETERKRRELAGWLAAVIERADERIEFIEPLWKFLSNDDETIQDDSIM